MTINELNDLIARGAAQPGVRDVEEMMRLAWTLDQQSRELAALYSGSFSTYLSTSQERQSSMRRMVSATDRPVRGVFAVGRRPRTGQKRAQRPPKRCRAIVARRRHHVQPLLAEAALGPEHVRRVGHQHNSFQMSLLQ